MGRFKLTKSEKARLAIGGFMVLALLVTIFLLPTNHGVKAPILALVSGVLILAGTVPANLPERDQRPALLGTTVGTIVALFAAGYWLSDATDGEGFQSIYTVVLVVALFLTYIAIIVWAVWLARTTFRPVDPFVARRKTIVRRVKQGLLQSCREVISAHKTRFTDYDLEISHLFPSMWSILENPHHWTYDPKAHQNLLENYLVALLNYTAEVAISKHPWQCKYGSVADGLAQQAELYLERVGIITELNPLPEVCPECKAAKPAHKASCMAAICWRCKYPTPPANPDRASEKVITPQCSIDSLCAPRGEAVQPTVPVVGRIKLPVTIPQAGENSFDILRSAIGGWPLNCRQLRDLLGKLQQAEDQA